MTSADKRKSHSTEWLFFAVLTLVLGLAGCGGQDKPIRLAGTCMGTTWHVTYVAAEGGTSPDSAVLQSGIEAVLELIEQSMSTYRDDSEISQFNAVTPNTWFEVSTEFYSVLSAALAVGRQSEGAYDVTVGPLVDLWGFGPAGMVPEPPADSTIQQVLEGIGQDRLRLDGETLSVRKLAPLSLDFSSIAKGYAVDRVAQFLEQHGVQRFLAEVGGEMRLSGMSHRGDPWHVAIEQPNAELRSVAQAISITDVSVATSGDYRNFFELDGKRFSHSIDPRSGYPVAHELVSVTVVHPGAMMADAWATALVVLGSDRAMAVAQEQGLAVYFIRREHDGYTTSHTPAFAPYLATTR